MWWITAKTNARSFRTSSTDSPLLGVAGAAGRRRARADLMSKRNSPVFRGSSGYPVLKTGESFDLHPWAAGRNTGAGSVRPSYAEESLLHFLVFQQLFAFAFQYDPAVFENIRPVADG